MAKRKPKTKPQPGEVTEADQRELHHLARRVEVWPLSRLRPSERNARVHPVEQIERLAASIVDFGFSDPIGVRADGTIVEGHGRLLAAERLGLTEVPVLVLDHLDERQARAYALMHNRSAELSEWDPTQLFAEIEELAAGGLEVFTAQELEELMPQDEPAAEREPEAEALEPAAPAAAPREPAPERELEVFKLQARPITAAGQLWILGAHRLLCGDSFEREDVGRLMGDEAEAALVLTDPPYAIYGSSTGIGADIADDKMVRPFFEALGRQLAERVQVFGHVYIHCDWRSWAAIWEGFRRGGLTAKNCLVWDKGGGGLGASYANAYELVGFFARLPREHAMSSSNRSGQRTVMRPNVLRFPRVSGEEREHNAAKPVALLEELVTNSSDAGDLVLDLFGGSGSTLMACERLGRRARLMEMEGRYCDVIVRRWQAATGLLARLEDGRTLEDLEAEQAQASRGRKRKG